MRKYTEKHNFVFDSAFSEKSTNYDIYEDSILPLVEFSLSGGKASCFAYGQTGSGKTYTMIGNE